MKHDTILYLTQVAVLLKQEGKEVGNFDLFDACTNLIEALKQETITPNEETNNQQANNQ